MIKRTKRKPCMILLFLLCMALYCLVYSLTVYAQEPESEDRTLAPYFLIQDGDPAVDRFPLKETEVSATVNGVIADTYVTQTYTNTGSRPIHGRYVFPASTKAAVHGMTMLIGDQVITAQIQEKEEARETFETAKEEGKSASLLEEQRANVFTMDVANVMPGDTIQIQLHYTERIDPVEGVYAFVFPTVVGPRYIPPSDLSKAEQFLWAAVPYLRQEDQDVPSYDIAVRLSTGVPICDLSSSSHTVSIARQSDSEAIVTLADPLDFAGDRDFILTYRLAGEDIAGGLTLTRGEEENFFLLSVQPPEHYQPETVVPREYLFVLDVSGSMDGYPLDTAKRLIHDLVSGLRRTDCFNVLLFSEEAQALSPSSVPATQEHIDRMLAEIDRRQGGGGTELNPALTDALAMPEQEGFARSIVVITDGYLSNDRDIFQTILQHQDSASFFAFGIGESVNRALIEGIAACGGGESFVVTDPAEAADTAARFCTYIEAPLLTDLSVSYEGFDAYDVEPALPGTLFAKKPIVLCGKWSGEPEGVIHIRGKSGTSPYAADIAVSDAALADGDSSIAYLWARSRLERLTTYAPYEDEDANRAAVTALGLTYHMATPYTSFVAVADTVRNPGGDGSNVDQPLPLPQGVSPLAVGGTANGYTVGAEPDLLFLAVPLGLLLLRRRKRRGAA